MKRKNNESATPVAIEGYTDFVRIGTGGFSVVYRAHESALNRNVAVKVLNAGLAEAVDRHAFERECKALGQLDHPDIVRVYRPAYTVDDKPCIVMELYEGNFREVLDQRGPLGAVELLDLGVRIAVALHVAHRKGVLHRDVKPHNIFRSRYGDPALGDFGISMIDDERSHSGASGLSIAYAAPELLEEGSTGVLTDVYALCATLHHLATGAAPFAAPDLRQSVRRILTDEPPPIGRADLPTGFERLLRAGMAKDPTARPATALALAEMLREAQARGGHLQTPIKLEETAADRVAPPPPDIGAAALPVIAAPAGSAATSAEVGSLGLPTASGGSSDASGGATIVRRAPGPVPVAVVKPGTSVRRRWIAAGAVAAVSVLVVVGVLVFGGSDGGSTADTTVAPTTPPVDSFLAVIDAPSDVGVSVTDGGASVSFTPVDGAVSYLVTPVGGVAEPVTVDVAALPVVIPITAAATVCVTVQSIGAGGRVSRPSAPVCATA